MGAHDDDRTAKADPADRFLPAACLNYDDVGPEQWAEARSLLAEYPDLTHRNVYAASAVADVDTLRRILADDPAAARREGGPNSWEPVLYLAYARHDPAIDEGAVLASTRLLLDAGADPNAGFLFHGLPTPFTALTGVFGEGELGPLLQPRHPHWRSLARVLLEAGADANDGQTLYNRMFEPGREHLELLLEFGLGLGRGGPWHQRMGDALDSPGEMVRGQLQWAITHGMIDRVRLLADHGVDISTPFEGGPTPTAIAAVSGYPEVVDELVGRGAPRPVLEPAEAFVAAALAADRATVDRLISDHPGLVGRVRTQRTGLVPWAATTGRPSAVELLVDLGFDVNSKGRTDNPSNQPWQTALHKAVEDGDLDLARVLLRLGADPDIKDERFKSTALGWARYFDRPELIALLEPLTSPEPSGQEHD